jgi:hypothetical protein
VAVVLLGGKLLAVLGVVWGRRIWLRRGGRCLRGCSEGAVRPWLSKGSVVRA